MTSYDTYIGLFIGAFLACYVLVPVIKRMGQAMEAYDPPSDRRVHDGRTPTFGGIAVALPIYLGIGFLFVWRNAVSEAFFAHQDAVIALLIGGAVVLALGVYDDIYGANAKVKFTFQILAAIIVCAISGTIGRLSIPFVGTVDLGIIAVPATIFWIVLVTNAFNFIDGIDGLAAGVGFLVCAGGFIVALAGDRVGMMVFTALMGGALLAFLRYNFHPASIFLGDTGSLFIGFSIAVASMHFTMKTSTSVMMFVPLFLLGYPLLDLTLAVTRRFIKGKPVFTSDRSHIHHKLLGCGLNHAWACMVGYGLTLLCVAVALLHVHGRDGAAAIILTVLGLALLVLFRVFGYWDSIRNGMGLARRRKYRLAHAVQRLAALKMDDADTPEELWDCLCWVGREFGIHQLYGEIQGVGSVDWLNPEDNGDPRERNHLIELPKSYGELHVIHAGEKHEDVEREHNVLMERLGETMVANMERLEAGVRIGS